MRRLPHARTIDLPACQSELAAGIDLVAALAGPLAVAVGERVAVPTGLAIALPPGWELQIRPRSGLALRQGLTCLNTPGTIDADYRGEIRVLLVNLGRGPVVVQPAARIAQAILAPHWRIIWHEVDELPESDRGSGGFGSTGT